MLLTRVCSIHACISCPRLCSLGLHSSSSSQLKNARLFLARVQYFPFLESCQRGKKKKRREKAKKKLLSLPFLPLLSLSSLSFLPFPPCLCTMALLKQNLIPQERRGVQVSMLAQESEFRTRLVTAIVSTDARGDVHLQKLPRQRAVGVHQQPPIPRHGATIRCTTREAKHNP